LEAFEVDFVASIEREIRRGEVFADDANQSGWGKKAGGDGGMAGGAAEETRIFGVRSFNGIQGGRTDDQYAHSFLFGSFIIPT
jgi:hypothetical protein